MPDPRLVDAGPFDLAALENGGRVDRRAATRFYGRRQQLIAPGLARTMGEGWETARRRDAGNDWVDGRAGVQGVVTLAELDTSYFLGNAPGCGRARPAARPDGAEVELLPRTRLQPDTRHRFVLDGGRAWHQVRLDVFPDGGMARLRLWGRPTAAGRAELGRRWFDALPDVQALEVLGSLGVRRERGRPAGRRPAGDGGPAARRSGPSSTAEPARASGAGDVLRTDRHAAGRSGRPVAARMAASDRRGGGEVGASPTRAARTGRAGRRVRARRSGSAACRGWWGSGSR